MALSASRKRYACWTKTRRSSSPWSNKVGACQAQILRQDADKLRIFIAARIQHGAKPYFVPIEPIQVISSGLQDYPFDFLDPVDQQRREECATGVTKKIQSLCIYPRELLD